MKGEGPRADGGVGHRWAEGTQSWGHSGGFGGRKCRRLVCLYLFFSMKDSQRPVIESERGRGVDSIQKRRGVKLLHQGEGKGIFLRKGSRIVKYLSEIYGHKFDVACSE